MGHDDNEEEGEKKDDNELATTAVVPRLRQEPMAHLTSLQLWYLGEEDLSETEFRSILAHCPNLTTSVVPAVHWIQHPQQLAQEIAQQLCPKLTNVEKASFDGNIANWELAFLIPGLTSDAAGSTFRRQSATLREIVLAGCRNFDTRPIRTILVECWSLERLEIRCRPLGGPNYPQRRPTLFMNLDDAIESPWGCTRIRNLDLTIAIPDEPFHRSNEMGVVPYYNRPPPTTLSPEETAQFQSLEAFYRQLGALTELERLKLKAIYYDPAGDRSADINFRLSSFPGMLNLKNEETGRPGYLQLLGELAKLKGLFGSVAAYTKETIVTIGMDEVKWMDKHWPALERAGFFGVPPVAPNPFSWFLEQRQKRGRKVDLCTPH